MRQRVRLELPAEAALNGGFVALVSGQHFIMDTTSEAPSVAEILANVAFPAEKWQITTCADIYGADLRTRRQLYGLPLRIYESPTDVLEALE